MLCKLDRLFIQLPCLPLVSSLDSVALCNLKSQVLLNFRWVERYSVRNHGRVVVVDFPMVIVRSGWHARVVNGGNDAEGAKLTRWQCIGLALLPVSILFSITLPLFQHLLTDVASGGIVAVDLFLLFAAKNLAFSSANQFKFLHSSSHRAALVV
jgi:hypothetical protein